MADASAEVVSRRPNLLLCVSGSVASIKTVELASSLQKFANVKIVVTKSALHFVRLIDLQSVADVYVDEQEWKWTEKGDPVLHIEVFLFLFPLRFASYLLFSCASGPIVW